MQLVVSVSTWTNHYCDGSCILEAADHEFLRHKSWVMYRKTRVESAETLDNGVQTGLFKVKPDMSREVFARVCAGILDSPHTPRKMKRYYQVQSGA